MQRADDWLRESSRTFPFERGEWRFTSPPEGADLPHAGWKIHVSATVTTVPVTLGRVARIVREYGVLAKCPRTLGGVARLNQGIGPSYSQVGKIFTVYPSSDEDFVLLGDALVAATEGCDQWPVVPFERQLSAGRPVFYRYGVVDPSADTTLGVSHLRGPDGQVVPDRRSATEPPAWVRDPVGARARTVHRRETMSFVGLRAVSQRGKGGVYLAVDRNAGRRHLCIAKEGRRHGETDFDGVDGRRRVLDEADALTALRGLACTPVLTGVETTGGHVYLKMEPIAGTELAQMVRAHVPAHTLRLIALRLVESVRSVHTQGWIWNDCKPANIVVGSRGRVHLLDFEGACPVASPRLSGYASPGYEPPRPHGRERTAVEDDVFALGVVLHELYGGRLVPGPHGAALVGRAWRASADLQRLLQAMRDRRRRRRPRLVEVIDRVRRDPLPAR